MRMDVPYPDSGTVFAIGVHQRSICVFNTLYNPVVDHVDVDVDVARPAAVLRHHTREDTEHYLETAVGVFKLSLKLGMSKIPSDPTLGGPGDVAGTLGLIVGGGGVEKSGASIALADRKCENISLSN